MSEVLASPEAITMGSLSRLATSSIGLDPEFLGEPERHYNPLTYATTESRYRYRDHPVLGRCA